MQDNKDPLGTGTPYPLAATDQQGHRGKSHRVRALGSRIRHAHLG